MGRHHARILSELPEAELVATCDVDAARAEEHAKLRGCRAATRLEELPADLDAAVVAVPTSRHADVAAELLERGVACLVEKPLAASLDEADRLLAAAERGGALLTVGHSERFNPGLARVRDAIREPLFVEAHRLGVFPARSLDVDVVLDLMIHDLDLLLWLSGGELVEVQAVGVNVLTPRVDIANARLMFSTGCTANVTASRVSADMTRKLRVFQEDSYVSVDFVEQTAEVFRLDAGEAGPEIQRRQAGPHPGRGKEEPLRHELTAFLAAVRDGGPSPVSGAAGRSALGAAVAVIEAMAAHDRRVEELRRG